MKGQTGTAGSMIGVIIGVTVSAIVVFQVAVPTIANAKEGVASNLSASEKAVSGLIILFLVLGLAFAAGRAFGIV